MENELILLTAPMPKHNAFFPKFFFLIGVKKSIGPINASTQENKDK